MLSEKPIKLIYTKYKTQYLFKLGESEMKINTRNLLYLAIAGVVLYLIAPKLIFLLIPFLPLIFCGVMCAAMVYMMSKQQKKSSLENSNLDALIEERKALDLKIEKLQNKILVDK